MKRFGLTAKSLVLIALLIGLATLVLMPMLATAAAKMVTTAVTITLTSKGIMVKPMSIMAGDHQVTVKNTTKAPRGIEMIGMDKSVSPYVRYGAVLKPGKSETFRWYFPKGKTAYIRDLLSCTHDQRSCVVATFGGMSKAIHVK